MKRARHCGQAAIQQSTPTRSAKRSGRHASARRLTTRARRTSDSPSTACVSSHATPSGGVRVGLAPSRSCARRAGPAHSPSAKGTSAPPSATQRAKVPSARASGESGADETVALNRETAAHSRDVVVFMSPTLAYAAPASCRRRDAPRRRRHLAAGAARRTR